VSDDLATKFERDGYVVIDDILEPATVHELRSLFLPIFEREKVFVLHDTVLHFPRILDVLRTPRLVQGLTALLGERFAVPPYSSVAFNGFGLFHTDTTGAEISGETFHRHRDCRIVTVAIYLQDNDEYGGGIRLAPGSHRQADPYVALTRRKAELRQVVGQSRFRRLAKRLSRGRLYDWNKPFKEHPRGVDIPSKAGDAIIWDLRMAHRATPKRAAGPLPHGGKLALFFNCGANNPVTTEAYMNYVLSIPENDFLRKPRPAPAADTTREFIIL
jgi:Phytanoyl-CoA dioxygenase (PhyH)